MRPARALLAGLALAAGLAGCAAIAPSTDQLADMAGRNIAARKTCADLLNRDRITAERGAECLQITDAVRAALEVARAGGVSDLAAARQSLLLLERMLLEASR